MSCMEYLSTDGCVLFRKGSEMSLIRFIYPGQLCDQISDKKYKVPRLSERQRIYIQVQFTLLWKALSGIKNSLTNFPPILRNMCPQTDI